MFWLLWGIVGLAADEATKEGGDDGLGDDDLIIDGSTFEMKEFHAYGLCSKDMSQMIAIDAVATDEPLKDVETLGGENVDATVLEKIDEGSAAFSMRRASMNCCDIAFAISRVIEKVVVVVFVITREGSLGSGTRLDWENLREARFAAASSLERDEAPKRVSKNVEKMRHEAHVEKEFGKERKNCLCVVSCKETMRVAKRSSVSWKGVGR
jgi:hypothetical protein